MIKVKLYEEFLRENLDFRKCKKTELKSMLYKLSRENIGVTDNIIVRLGSNEYEVYFYNSQKKGIDVKLDPAARTRLETEFGKLEYDIRRFEDSLKACPVRTEGDKYCLIKQVDFKEDYLILDVYVKYRKGD